jgi:predicted RNase H-like nuclease (RuvC/YqgF family)|tara:strand:- start:544 stop:711 length:168 start_codon:yes stop_codon:yes gene_type:complete
MKVYGRGDADLERRIEVLTARIKELEEINEEHKKLNGKLREELESVRQALTRISR